MTTLEQEIAHKDGSLAKLYQWLGERAVLLPLPFGKKRPELHDWQSITFERTQESNYQERLKAALDRRGNIGVLLADGLAAIDIDNDAFVDGFLELNPALAETLRSRGERGCQLWMRMIGDYPQKIHKLKKTCGATFGEWRGGGGAQSVIAGQHPNSTPEKPIRYVRIVGKPAVEIAFADIVWPADVVLPWEEKEPQAPRRPPRDLDKRINAYVAAIPGAVSGANGHDETFKVACALVNGWSLTAAQAMPYLQVYNQRCQPPWSDKDLTHKLSDAERVQHDKPRGHLRSLKVTTNKTENDCQYPPVNWSELAKQNDDKLRFHHPAIYPEDSILQPFMETGREICEGADCYIIGSILPVVAAMLDRRVFLPWAPRKIYTNIFTLLVGKAGDRKSSTMSIATRIALECLPSNALLSHLFSPESLFDEYCSDAGGRPDKLWLVDDANPILKDWKLSSNGERVAARFLPLYDCGRLTESFRRNKSETISGRREVPETSTSILFGATFNVATFQGHQVRAGLARRFLYYVADAHGRVIIRPEKLDICPLADMFKSLLLLEGEIDFSADAFPLWEKYQRENREQLEATNYFDEALASRLSSAPTHVQKIAMLFQACRCIHHGDVIKEITRRSLELAIKHVDENMRSAAFLESIAERAVTAQRAELVLATVRRKFPAARPSTIYATRSELTYELCHQGARQGALKVDKLYGQIIPHLEAQGVARIIRERGKSEVYAFQTEDASRLCT